MAGRPRQYETEAEKAQAYRARRKQERAEVNRGWYEGTLADLERLMRAIERAWRAGDALAATLTIGSQPEMLRSLADHFESVAEALSNPGPSTQSAKQARTRADYIAPPLGPPPGERGRRRAGR